MESEFSLWLRQAMATHGLNQAELLRRYREQFDDMTSGQLSDFCRSIHSPSKAKAERIALVLGTPLPPLYQPWHRWNPKPDIA